MQRWKSSAFVIKNVIRKFCFCIDKMGGGYYNDDVFRREDKHMIRIAVVDDSKQDMLTLVNYIEIYAEKHGVDLDVTKFDSGTRFIAEYTPIYDLIFLDIIMPNVNGMKIAEDIRKQDKTTKLIFVSNMAKFAVKGYEVDALSYLLKPINYTDVESKLNKAIALIQDAERETVIRLVGGSVLKTPVKAIYYVEVAGHKISYHFKEEVAVMNGTLSKIEEDLYRDGFLRCNNCYLVNPRYIKAIDGYDITMTNGDLVRISHPRKKKFMEELAVWLGKGNMV